jgi:hypothetical protein
MMIFVHMIIFQLYMKLYCILHDNFLLFIRDLMLMLLKEFGDIDQRYIKDLHLIKFTF